MLSRTLLLSVTGVALAVPLATIGLDWLIGQNQPVGPKLSLGYLELSPPSRLFEPGTITTVETLSDGSVQLHLACRMDNEELRKLTNTSGTVNYNFIEKVSNSLDVQAKALGAIASRTTSNRITQVAGVISDMLIRTMNEEDLQGVLATYLKGPCQAAILKNIENGARVCQLKEVLQGDIAYQFVFSAGVGVDEQLDLVNKVAGSANLENATASLNEIRGDDLFLGIKADIDCLTLDDDLIDVAGT
jgi:hypothetical protein